MSSDYKNNHKDKDPERYSGKTSSQNRQKTTKYVWNCASATEFLPAMELLKNRAGAKGVSKFFGGRIGDEFSGKEPELDVALVETHTFTGAEGLISLRQRCRDALESGAGNLNEDLKTPRSAGGTASTVPTPKGSARIPVSSTPGFDSDSMKLDSNPFVTSDHFAYRDAFTPFQKEHHEWTRERRDFEKERTQALEVLFNGLGPSAFKTIEKEYREERPAAALKKLFKHYTPTSTSDALVQLGNELNDLTMKEGDVLENLIDKLGQKEEAFEALGESLSESRKRVALAQALQSDHERWTKWDAALERADIKGSDFVSTISELYRARD